MLPLSLSSDLFIVVFFAVTMSFVFIVHTDKSVRLILGTYVAIIATQGTVSVLTRIMAGSEDMLLSAGIPSDPTLVSLGKIFLFSLFMIIFLVRSGIEISYEKQPGTIMNIVATTLLGFSIAGLLASTVLSFVADSGLLSGVIALQGIGLTISGDSTLLKLMIINREVWYTLPAFLLIVIGILHSD